MLITFKCGPSADVAMYEQHVQPLFDLLGKELKRGVITVAEIDNVIHLLEGEIAKTVHEKSSGVEHDVLSHHGENGDDPSHEASEPVAYSARMRPLLKMLHEAKKAGKDILWGV